MATINQIRKQVETSSKRIEGYNAKVKMYAERAAKNLAIASKRFMTEFTEENFKELSRSLPNMDWELDYKIGSAIEYRELNKRDAARETSRLESLKAELAKMEADAMAKEESEATLKNALVAALADFKVVWFDRMTRYYEAYFVMYRKMLPEATEMLSRARATAHKLCYRYRWHEHQVIRKKVEGIIKEQKAIICDEANVYDHDEFMSRRMEEMTATWERGIQTLTEKCKTFGVDETKLKTIPGRITEDGIQVIITDGKNRVIDARIIWAAENSVYVTPHTRYIVTERHEK